MEENKETNENVTTYQVSNEQPVKKKGKKGLIIGVIIIAILLIASVAGYIYYTNVYMRPDNLYKKIIGSALDSFTEEVKKLDYTTAKTEFKLGANVELEDDSIIDKSILDLVNKTDVKIETQVDTESKEIILNLESNYDKEDLINAQMYINTEDEKTYIELENFLDKYIEVEQNDNDIYTEIEEILEKQRMTNEQKKSFEKAMNIFKKELFASIKEKYCSSEKTNINLNGKDTKVTKNTIKMNIEQLSEETKTICENLKDNKEFIDCFEEKDEVSDTLENIIDQINDSEEYEDASIEINIYTQGIIPSLVKLECVIYNESEKEVTIAATKIGKDEYQYEVITSETDANLNGTVKIEGEEKVSIALNIPSFGRITMNVEYNQKLNESINNVNVEDAVAEDELTEKDQETLIENLQKSKLYELIESFSKSTDLYDAYETDEDNYTLDDSDSYDWLYSDESESEEQEDYNWLYENTTVDDYLLDF